MAPFVKRLQAWIRTHKRQPATTAAASAAKTKQQQQPQKATKATATTTTTTTTTAATATTTATTTTVAPQQIAQATAIPPHAQATLITHPIVPVPVSVLEARYHEQPQAQPGYTPPVQQLTTTATTATQPPPAWLSRLVSSAPPPQQPQPPVHLQGMNLPHHPMHSTSGSGGGSELLFRFDKRPIMEALISTFVPPLRYGQ